MKTLFSSIIKTITNPQLLLPQTKQRIRFTCTLLALAATGSNLAVAQVEYQESDGIYMSMYGVPAGTDRFTAAVDAALQLPYIKGIAFYPQWNELQPGAATYDWSDFNHVVKSAIRYKKKVILGLVAGVSTPEWVLNDSLVEKIDFVHANEGWLGWTTKKEIRYTTTQGAYYVSTAPLPWNNPKYDSLRETTLTAINDQIVSLTGIPVTAANPHIAFINVCGPSVSGGTETNLVIDWVKSIDNDKDFVANFKTRLGISNSLGGGAGSYREKYAAAWKASITKHLQIFPNLKLGLGLHHDTGGPDTDGSAIQRTAAKIATAVDIRDYLIEQHTLAKHNTSIRGKPHLRNLGLSTNENLWGNDTDKLPSSFVTLVTNQKNAVDIGYESGTVAKLNWGSVPGTTAQPDDFYDLLKMGMDHYGRILEIKTPDIIEFKEERNLPDKAYAYGPYVPALKKAARLMQPKTDKIFWTGPSSTTDTAPLSMATLAYWVTIHNTTVGITTLSNASTFAGKKLVFGPKKQSTPTENGPYTVTVSDGSYSGLIFDVDAPSEINLTARAITLNGNIEVAGYYPSIFHPKPAVAQYVEAPPVIHKIDSSIAIPITDTSTPHIVNRTINTGSNATIKLVGVVSGTGGLTKAGSGTLKLSANNTYTGSTLITEGTLEITGSPSSATGNITVGPTDQQATLRATGMINGNVTINKGGTLAPLGSLDLNAKNLTLNTGAKLQFRLGATGSNDKITKVNLLNPLSSTSSSTPLKWSDFTFIPDANFAGGVFTLIDQTANTATTDTLITSGLIDSINAQIRLINGDLVLKTTTAIKTWTGNATGTHAQKTGYNSAGNWSDIPTTADTIRFNTMSGTPPIHTTLPEDASAFGIQVKNTNKTSIVASTADRTMTIDRGGITINAGTFTLGAPATATTPATTPITKIQLVADQSWLNNGLAMLITPYGEINLSGKSLTLGGSGSIAINGPITNPSTGAPGTLIKDGTGTLSISGTNHTYRGPTTIKDGTLKLTGSIINSDVTVDRDALLSTTDLANTKSVTLSAGGRLAIDVSATTDGHYNLKAQNLNLANGDLELNVPNSLGVGTYHVAWSTGGAIQYPIGKPIKITGIQGKIVKSPNNRKLHLRIRGFDKWRYANINNAHLRTGYTGARNDLYNYAFGLNNVGPVVEVSHPRSTSRSISYTRTFDNDLTYTLEYSTNLVEWNTEGLVIEPGTGTGTQTVTATLATTKVPLTEPRLFFRVRVEAN